MNKKVQIIMPVLNRLELTKQTIESLYKNTPIELFDLFIIDDGSDKETEAYIFEIATNNQNIFAKRNPQSIGPGAARNMAIDSITSRGMRGEYLYSSDNDVYFNQGWLEQLVEVYEQAEKENLGIKLLGASCHPFLQNNMELVHLGLEEPHGNHSKFGCSCGSPTIIGLKDAVSGYSQLMTWGTWDEFGPFDEGSRGLEHKTGRSEDWALCQKIINAGFLVGSVEPELIVPCGKTDTYGRPAVGQETFKDVEGIVVQ